MCVRVSDGKRLASGCDDGKVVLWDTQTGQAVWRLEEHELRITGFAWLASSQCVAVPRCVPTPCFTTQLLMLVTPVGGGRYMFQVEGAASKSSRNMASSNHVGRKLVIAGKDNTLAVYQEKFDRRSSRRNVARAASRGGKASQEGYELMCRVDWLKSPIMSLSFSRQTFMYV